MSDYNIFLPTFSGEVLTDTLAFLEKRGVTCELSPKFKAGEKPPIETLLHLAIRCRQLRNWPLGERKILTAFKLKVLPFNLNDVEEKQKAGLNNLFGLIRKGNSALDIKKLRSDPDNQFFPQLKSCKREVRLTEDDDAFASRVFTPMFAVALTLAGDGLIYEGEFFDKRNVERDFWPSADEIKYIKEDIDEGGKPVFFDQW
jgi:hypothetical protein